MVPAAQSRCVWVLGVGVASWRGAGREFGLPARLRPAMISRHPVHPASPTQLVSALSEWRSSADPEEDQHDPPSSSLPFHFCHHAACLCSERVARLI